MTAPIVTIQEGQVKGKSAQDYLGDSYYSFSGIPYAKAPVGELRFKAPVPAEPFDGIFDATKEGPECPSRHMLFAYNVGSEENCLNLNVYTKKLPSEDGATLKPVMVWIHGGAFLHGCNKSEFFGPDYLITEDIVIVSINYRLGILGFLALEDPALGVPGNAAFKDMIQALRWVQANIRSFNGDPNNVTIFGESAGSAAVHYLYLSPMSKGLFHKAIAQSGCALNSWAIGRTNGADIAKDLGFKETDEAKILAHLRSLPATKIVKAQHKFPYTFSGEVLRPYGPVIEPASDEPAFLREHPKDIVKAGTFNHLPLIMGYTSKEGLFYDAVRKLESMDLLGDFEAEIPFDLKLIKGSEGSLEVAGKIKKFYFGTDDPSENNAEPVHLLKSDTQFIHGIHQSVSLQKQLSEAPIYLYRMSLETSINYYKTICTSKSMPLLFFLYFLTFKSGEGMGKKLFMKLSNSIPRNSPSGVCHADDVGYLFKSFYSSRIESNSLEDISIKRFTRLWGNFARTGNPTPDPGDQLLKTEWKPVSKEDNHFLDIGSELKTGTNPDCERMQFWDSIYA